MSPHIEALTRGVTLPDAAVDADFMEAMADTLVTAWNVVRSTAPLSLNENEVHISSLIAIELNNLRRGDTSLEDMFHPVNPAPEWTNFDGTKLQKKPDIVIYWNSPDHVFPLMIECKIIDRKDAKGVSLYTNKGLKRFLDGTYSWGSREAMMLAFVRDASTVSTALTPHLQRAHQRSTQLHHVLVFPAQVITSSHDLSISRHNRPFRYINRPAPRDVPGAIDLWHLWVS